MATKSLGTLTVDLLAKVGAFEKGMDDAVKKFSTGTQKIKDKAADLGKTVAPLVAGAFVAVGAVITKAVYDGIEAADKFDEVSARLSIGVEKLQELNFSANLSGVGFEELTSALPKLSKVMVESEKEASKFGAMFDKLGLSAKDAEGNFKNTEDFLLEIANVFKEFDDPVAEAALAMELFGKSGAQFLEWLNRGGDEIETMGQQARDLGLIIGEETAGNIAEMKDQIGNLTTASTAFGAELAGAVAPTIISLIEEFMAWKEETGAVQIAVDLLKGAIDVAVFSFNNIMLIAKGVVGALAAVGMAVWELGKGILDMAKGAGTALMGVFTFDWGKIQAGIAHGLQAVPDTIQRIKTEVSNVVSATTESMAENVSAMHNALQNGYVNTRNAAHKAKKEAEALANGVNEVKEEGKKLPKDLFDPVTKSAKAATKAVKEQKEEVDKLTQSYETLMKQLHREAWMVGKEGRGADIEYQTTFGDLAGLDDERKQKLKDAAALVDMRNEEKKQREEAIKLAEKEAETYQRNREQMAGILDDLSLANELLGKSRDEQEQILMLKEIQGIATEEETQAIMEQLTELQKRRKEIEMQVELMDTVRSAASTFVQDLVSGTMSVGDAFKKMFDDINARIVQMIADRWIEQLFGEMGSMGGGNKGRWRVGHGRRNAFRWR